MRICQNSLKTYLQDKLGKNYAKVNYHKISGYPALLQDEYGARNDCTLVCITACTSYHTRCPNLQEIYMSAVNFAGYSYNSKLFGTIPIFIKSIYNKTLNKFGLNYKSKSKYIKSLGFDFNDIVDIILDDKPIILSAQNMNDFYKNHSVSVIGFATYTNNKDTVYMLLVYDNWYKTVSYIDYDTISKISCINY